MAITKKRWILILVFVLIAGLLILISMSHLWVESHYTYGFYQFSSAIQRRVFGWLPFSFGDFIYMLFILWILYIIVRNVVLLFVRKLTLRVAFRKFTKLVLRLVLLYVFFLLIWGLNYSRKGIRYQLELERPAYNDSDMLTLHRMLAKEVNSSKVDLMSSQAQYPKYREIFERAVVAYGSAVDSFPFLRYKHPSLKPSLFGSLTNYMGFTGYYNPFTGEAQVNTTVPKFLVPSITLHEMAHQIGYAKENEANFVGFLVGSQCSDPLFRYSVWIDLLMYTNSRIRRSDPALADTALQELSQDVRNDIEEWRRFSQLHYSFLEPVMHWVYERYLKLNKQSQGMKSYDAVVSLVIAYYKKEGNL